MTYNVHIFIVFICLWRSRVKEFMQFAQGRTIVHFKEVFYYSRFRKIFLKIPIQILAIILYFRNCSCSLLRIISCNSYTREYLVFHEEGAHYSQSLLTNPLLFLISPVTMENSFFLSPRQILSS